MKNYLTFTIMLLAADLAILLPSWQGGAGGGRACQAQTSYTWNGSVSSNFTTAGNWTPSGSPTSADNVTIVSSSNNPVLAATDTVNKLTITSGTLDLGGYGLRVQNELSMTGGTVSNGTLLHRSNVASMLQDATLNCILDAEGNGIDLDNMVLNDTVRMLKTANTSGTRWGNNNFNGPVTINNQSDSLFATGVAHADTFLLGLVAVGDHLSLFHSSADNYVEGTLDIDAASSANVAANTYTSVDVNGDILLALASGTLKLSYSGQVTQQDGFSITNGTNGIQTTVYIGNLLQAAGANINLSSDRPHASIILTGSTVGRLTLAVTNVIMNKVNVMGRASMAAGSFGLTRNRFFDTADLTKTGSITNYHHSNCFYGPTIITQQSEKNDIYWGRVATDTFLAPLTLINLSEVADMVLGHGAPAMVCSDLTVQRDSAGAIILGDIGGLLHFKSSTGQHYTSTGIRQPICYNARLTSLSPSPSLSLLSPLTIRLDLAFVRGTVHSTSGNELIFLDNSTATTASDTGHVIGPVIKEGNDAFTFPVGRNGVYRPIAISAPDSLTASFMAEYFEKSADPHYDLASRDTTLHGISANEYWTLERLASSNNVSVTLKWDTLTSCSMTSPITDVRVAGWDAGTSKWKDRGNSATTGNMVEGTVTSGAAVSAFTAFTVGHRYSGMGCRHADLTWAPDTLLIDSVSEFFVSASGLPSGYSTSLWIEGAGYFQEMTYHELALLDTIRASIHLRDSAGLLKATLYFVNAIGNYVDSLNYLIPYRRISGGAEDQCETTTPECDYIVNGNFAESQGFPNGYSQIGLVNNWNKVTVDDYCQPIDEYCLDWYGTTDFFQANATDPNVSVPLNNFTTIPVNSLNLNASDDAYVGILSWLPYANNVYVTEYLTQEIPTALTPGETYRLRLHVQLSNRSTDATRVGVLFTEDLVCHTSNVGPILLNQLGQPYQLMDSEPDPATGYLIDFDEWHVVDFTFVAQENWKHLTIGQFTLGNSPVVNGGLWETTGAVPLIGGPGGPTVPVTQSYWFIDEVSLIPIKSCCMLPENVEYDDDELTTTTGNTTTLTGQMTISGILNLSGGGEFVFDNANVIMEPGAQINVNANTKLTVTNGTRIHSCTEMWNMIHVRPTAEIVVDEGSLIEDATFGIFLVNGSLYTLDNARLNKNYIHMFRMASFNGPSSTGTITNSSFTCQTTESLWLGGAPDHENLIAPLTAQNSYIGIANFATPIVGQPNSNLLTVGAIGQGNWFDHARYGIYTIGNLTSNGNTFSNIWISPNLTDFNEGSGIFSRGRRNLSVLNSNHFERCLQGVNSWSNDLVSIRGNVFEQCFSGIGVREPNDANLPPVVGKTATINGNTFFGTTSGIVCQNNRGASITIGTPTEPNYLYISSFFTGYTTPIQMGTGILVEESIPFLGSLVRTENNVVDDAYFGIRYRNLAFAFTDLISGIFQNTIQVHDGPMYGTSFPFGNPFGIRADGIKTLSIDNNYVTPMAITNWNKSGIVVSTSSEVDLTCNTTEGILIGLQFQSGAHLSRPIRNLMLDDFYGLVLNQTTLADIGTITQPWDNQWDGTVLWDTYVFDANAGNTDVFYRWTGGSPYEPLNNVAFDAAFVQQGSSYEVQPSPANSSAPNFPDICAENGTHGFAPDSVMQAMLVVGITDTTTQPSYHNELRWTVAQQAFELIFHRDSIAIGHSLLTAFKDSCHDANLGQLYRAMAAHAAHQKPETLEVHLDTLQGMTTTIVPEAALRDVLVVIFEKDVDTSTVVDSVSYRLGAVLNAMFPDSTYLPERIKDVTWNWVQDSTLRHIAAQCPTEFGKAVYMARAALGLNDTIPYSGVHECEVMDLPISARHGIDEESEPDSSLIGKDRSSIVTPILRMMRFMLRSTMRKMSNGQ